MSSIRTLFAALVLAPAAVFAQDATQPASGTRPSITVSAFEHGTVATQIANDRNTRRRLERMGIRDASFAEALGVGAADLIIEELVRTGAFRVLERKIGRASCRE